MFDSKEEMYFSWYLDELKNAGFINDWDYIGQSKDFSFELAGNIGYTWDEKLKTKTKIKHSKLLRAHTYTPDFRILWNSKAHNIFYNQTWDRVNLKKIPFIAQSDETIPVSVIDIKPSFDRHNMTRLFTIIQSWIYQRYELYVQKIIITGKKSALFPTTFTPQRYFFTDKTKQPRKLNYNARTLSEFIKEHWSKQDIDKGVA